VGKFKRGNALAGGCPEIASLYLNLKKPRTRIPRAPINRRGFCLAATFVKLTPETHLQGERGVPIRSSRDSLRGIGAQSRADVVERLTQTLRQKLRTGCSTKADQANDQSVLDQVLAFLATQQILQPQIMLEKHAVHFVIPPTRLNLLAKAEIAILLQSDFRTKSECQPY